MSSFLTLDLGNSNCRAAALADGKVEIIPSCTGGSATPSLVSFTSTGDIAGEDAKQHWDKQPNNTIFCSNILMGDATDAGQFPDFLPTIPYKVGVDEDQRAYALTNGRRRIYPQQVVQLLALEMTKLASEHLGEELEEVTLCVPGTMSFYNRIGMKTALEAAGLKCQGFVNASTAAVCGQLSSDDSGKLASRNILVVDVGSSSMDVAVIVLENSSLDVVSRVGTSKFGGDVADQILFKYMADLIELKYDQDVRKNAKAMVNLRDAVRVAKQVVSVVDSSNLHLTNLFPKICFKEHVSRMLISQLCKDVFRTNLEDLVNRVLQNANFTKEQISEVVLAGGAVGMPLVQQLIRELFAEQTIICKSDRHETAIKGAVSLAHGWLNGFPGLPASDILGTSLGFLQSDGSIKTLISPDSQFPAEGECVLPDGIGPILEILEIGHDGTVRLATVDVEQIFPDGLTRTSNVKLKLIADHNVQLDLLLTNMLSGQVVPVPISENIKEKIRFKMDSAPGPDLLERCRLEAYSSATNFTRGIKRKADKMKLEVSLSDEEKEKILKGAELLDSWMEENPTASQLELLKERRVLDRLLNEVLGQRIKKGIKFFNS